MPKHSASQLPSALQKKQQIIERLQEENPVIFLDYDGTLTPIVDDPQQAQLSPHVRRLLETLSELWTVVVVSGRALKDVKAMVGMDHLMYAGSHGLNMAGPRGSFHEEPGKRFLPAIDKAESELEERITDLPGVRLERKPYAIALHYRQAEQDIVPELEKRLDDVASHHSELTKTTGKKIFELRPKTEWDKGKAVLYLLDKLCGEDTQRLPVYIGDDVTDEDAFKVIADDGIGILVSDENPSTAAHYTLRDPNEVSTFLEALVTLAEKVTSLNIWSLTYKGFNPDSEKLREALCTVGNGYFATRGAVPESVAGDVHYPGTYISGLYNRLNSTIEKQTVENESMVNVPNWLPLNFRIQEGDWFDLESVNVLEYVQELDMKCGILYRTVRFEDFQKRRTLLKQRRFVHMRHKHIAALETTLQAENWSGALQIRSALDGRVENTLVARYRLLNNHHLEQLGTGVTDDGVIWLYCKTNQSHIRIAEAARTRLFQENHVIDIQGKFIKDEGYIAQEFEVDIQAGKTLRIEKIISLYHSRDLAISESRVEAQERLRHVGSFDSLLNLHTIAWDHLWERWGISVEAETRRIEQVHNLHIFHLLQTVSPNTVDLDVGAPPRGLHGEAYRGLIMWDELFIIPLLNLRIPDITRGLLMYRYRRLPRAEWAAEHKGYRGAMFPWQSGSDGQEQAQTLHLNPESGRWIPDNSQLQRHINIAIAYNIWLYYQVTGDVDFISFYGAVLFIKIVRFWASKANYNESLGRYEIRKVMGPDEFHDSYPDASEAGIDNNTYTNVMVAWTLCRALDMLDILPKQRKTFIMDDLEVTQEELNHWDEMSRNMRVVFHEDGILSQFEGYEDLEEFDWQAYRNKYGDLQRLDRILEAEGDTPNRYKLSKQADVLMLFYLLSADELEELFNRMGYPFEHESIPKNIEYYLQRTSHGSTLSRVVHAWLLVRSNRKTSWQLFQDALESDIEDIQGGTTPEGIHLGAMAGTVDLILRCYSGVETRGDVLWFNPKLPDELKSLRFGIGYRGTRIEISITRDQIELSSSADAPYPVKIGYDSDIFQLEPGQTKTLQLS